MTHWSEDLTAWMAEHGALDARPEMALSFHLDLLERWTLNFEMYVCGVRIDDQGGFEPVYTDFVEQRFTGSYTLRAHLSAKPL